MKILDPQSALLTNAEVYQFLRSKPKRTPDKIQGAYAVTNLSGHKTILKDFDAYTKEVTPHVTTMAPLDTFIKDLVRKLKPYELTKTEVMNLVNMGLGVRVVAQQEDEEEPDEETIMARDVQFFRVAIEESDERFADDEGEERIREVIGIMKECMETKQK